MNPLLFHRRSLPVSCPASESRHRGARPSLYSGLHGRWLQCLLERSGPGGEDSGDYGIIIS